ncbi:hypothetical protein V9T40_005603 [Parthenolecanium corni]|uniref:Broad-complex n=1 Tax=Parthenolecanium corni TaxID=536013 RepID=A0AAN9TT62_9HEMI
MAADHFCLRWNNYQSNMVSELDSLRSDEDLVDVTLSCEGHLLKAHKVILSACSSYFRNVFKENPCKHPVVILKDVNYEDVEALLSFVYQGVVYISEKKLNSFLQTAELLQIRGLTGAATTMKEASFSDVTTNQKVNDKSNVPPPPQLLTANLLNSWNKQSMMNSSCSTKSSNNSNPTSPSLPSGKRKRTLPNKLPAKENFESSDTNSNQDCSEAENDLPTVKSELIDTEVRGEDDYNSIDDMTREESSQEENRSYFENMESDENEDENSETKKRKTNPLMLDQMPSNPLIKGDLGPATAAACSNLFNIVSNYTSPLASSDQNSSASESKWKCMKPQECKICHKTFSNAGNLRQHVTNVHTPGEPVQCELCSKEFKNKEYLRKHKVIIHKAPLRSHLAQCGNCPHCGKTYSNQSALKYHVRLMHCDLTNQFSCYLCPMSFAHRDDYKAHMWEIHKVRS